MAEGILRSLLAARSINDFAVESAGIGAMDGMPATPFAIEVAKHWQVDISSHRSRMLTKNMIRDADLILAMSTEHAESILRKEPSAAKKTFLIRLFPSPLASGQEGVKDPIGGTLEDYNQTYLELDEILRRAESRIVNMAEALKKNS
jgi:protein-tyrosine-phosphatase